MIFGFCFICDGEHIRREKIKKARTDILAFFRLCRFYLFSSAGAQPVCTTVSGFRERLSIPSSISRGRKVFMVRRTPAANPDIFTLFLRRADGHGEQRFHRLVTLIEQLRDNAGVAVRGRAPAASCHSSQWRSRRSAPRNCSASRALDGISHIMMIFSPFSPRFSP